MKATGTSRQTNKIVKLLDVSRALLMLFYCYQSDKYQCCTLDIKTYQYADCIATSNHLLRQLFQYIQQICLVNLCGYGLHIGFAAEEIAHF